tara:strand:+ start:690 stop:1505 length:816 start_codon:yes stop_codon:yes gene_type:complete
MATRTKVWDQTVKTGVRAKLLQKRGVAFQSALFMPADTAYCVEEAKNSGMIDDETELILVDKDSTTLSLGYDRCVDALDHNDEYIQLRHGKVEDALKELRLDDVAVHDDCHCLEFLYLDTCGELSPTMVDALKTAVENKVITEKTTIAFTFSTAQRMWDTSYAKHFVRNRLITSFNTKKEPGLWTAKFEDDEFCHPFSENKKRNKACNIIAQTIKHATKRAFSRIAFGCAYKEVGNSFPMMTAIILGKGYKDETENPFMDIGYNEWIEKHT